MEENSKHALKKMEKYFFALVVSALLFHSPLTAQENHSLIVQVKGCEDHEMNVVGLVLAEVVMINQSEKRLTINIPSQMKMYGNLVDSKSVVVFDEGNLRFSTGRTKIYIEPGDTLTYKININTLELLQPGRIQGLDKCQEIAIRFGVFSYTEHTEYYSPEIRIKINPLSKIDRDAFLYIKENGFDPFDIARRETIVEFGIDEAIADSLMTKYPESAFAELASLTLAYQRSREAAKRTELIPEARQLLVKPLSSKYAFVRYLAEELKKKLN